MKTTVDLPDSLYRRAKIRAAQRGTTLRTLLVESLEQSLMGNGPSSLELPARDRFERDDIGWPVLRPAPGDSHVITDDFINRLRDEEGV